MVLFVEMPFYGVSTFLLCAAARLWLTIQTPVKTSTIATNFFQVMRSKPMAMLMSVAMMGCT